MADSWVSTKNQMPEHNQYVEVLFNLPEMPHRMRCDYRDRFWWYEFTGKEIWWRITERVE